MRSLVNLLLFFSSTLAIGQNYQPINSNSARYFGLDNTSASFGFRVDSIQNNGADTSYFCYPSFKASGSWPQCVRLNSLSVLGNRIDVLNNGISWFYDKNEDTIQINHAAALNDEWVMFQQSADTIIKGIVTSINQDNWLGVDDLIKTISISIVNDQGQPVNHPLSGEQILIGENLGILRFPNLDSWPYDTISMTAVGDQPLNIGLRNLTISDVYDFEICDEFHFEERFENSPVPPDDRYYRKTILGKQVSQELVTYIIQTEGFKYEVVPSSGPQPYVSTTELIFSIDTLSYNLNAQLGSPLFPNELQLIADSQFDLRWKKPRRLGLFNDRISNGFDVSYPEYFIYSDTTLDLSMCLSGFTDGCCPCCPYDTHRKTYAEGLGLTEVYTVTGATATPRRKKLVYYNKCGDQWGNPISESVLNGISDQFDNVNFSLYPNPASQTVRIQLNQQDVVEIQVLDVLGRMRTLTQARDNQEKLNVSKWPNGVYLISIINKDGIRNTQRLLVQH